MSTSIPDLEAQAVPNSVLTWKLYHQILNLCIGTLEPDGTSVGVVTMHNYANNIKQQLLALTPDKDTATATEGVDRLNLRKEVLGKAERGIAMLKKNEGGCAAGFDKVQSGQANVFIKNMGRELVKLEELLTKAEAIAKETKAFEKAAPNGKVYGLAMKLCPQTGSARTSSEGRKRRPAHASMG